MKSTQQYPSYRWRHWTRWELQPAWQLMMRLGLCLMSASAVDLSISKSIKAIKKSLAYQNSYSSIPSRSRQTVWSIELSRKRWNLLIDQPTIDRRHHHLRIRPPQSNNDSHQCEENEYGWNKCVITYGVTKWCLSGVETLILHKNCDLIPQTLCDHVNAARRNWAMFDSQRFDI